MGLIQSFFRALSASFVEQGAAENVVDQSEVVASCRDFVYGFEGERLEAYYDSIGFPTQGVGRLLSRQRWADLSQWPAITHDVAMVWLDEDLDKVSRGVLRLLPIPLNDNEKAALTSFAFNLGLGALEASTLRRRLLRGEPRGQVAAEFLKWNHAGGMVSKGLTRRRIAERNLFLS